MAGPHQTATHGESRARAVYAPPRSLCARPRLVPASRRYFWDVGVPPSPRRGDCVSDHSSPYSVSSEEAMTANQLAGWLTESPIRSATTMNLVDDVDRGLLLESVDTLSRVIAPGNNAFKYHLVPKATYNRRRIKAGPKAARLSKEESERLVRL